MMGQLDSGQDKLFYSFNLDNHVPQTHLLRGIDRALDLGDLRQHLAPFYSPIGRPSIDPEFMIRMLIVGYCFGIRSERRLCEEVHLNLAYRWFCRLGLDDAVPEHSTFSKNRHGRFRDSDVLRHVFESVLGRCMAEGLVRGEGFAIDASIIKADASRSSAVPGTDSIDWGPAARQSRAVREYLQALEESNPVGSDAAESSESSNPPKMISLSDPASSWTAAPGGPAFFAYTTNYLIDLEAGIIMDVEATPANRSHEVESTRTMIERVEQGLCLKPARLVGDTAYGTAAMLGWMVDQKEIAPHVPVWEKYAPKDNAFSNASLSGMRRTTSIVVQLGKHCAVTAANLRTRVRTSPRPIRLSIDQANSTGPAVQLRNAAVRRPRFARSRAASTKLHVTRQDASRQHLPTNNPDVSERRWKCSSRTSNAS
jgi:transposase